MKLERRLWVYYLLPYRAVFEGGKSLVKSNFRALTAFWLQFGITVLITAYQVIPQTSEHDHLSQGKPDLKANFQQSLFFLPNLSNKYGGIIICDSTRDRKQRLKLLVFSAFFWVFLIVVEVLLSSRNTGMCLSKLLFQGSLHLSARYQACPPFPGTWQIVHMQTCLDTSMWMCSGEVCTLYLQQITAAKWHHVQAKSLAKM